MSNAEPREALIPWGKMRSLLSTEPVAVRDEPWGCTGCGACTRLCRHDNPVADVLIEGRSSVLEAGRAPEAAVRVAREHPGRLLRQTAALEALAELVPTDPRAPIALLLGCPTLRDPDGAGEAVVRAAARLAEAPLRLLSECCGLIPALAGDGPGSRLAQERLARSLRGVERLVVVDPGCGHAVMRLLSESRGATRRLESTSFFAWAAAHGQRLRPLPRNGRRFGWQLPCWARGTAAEPGARVLLEQLVGEFVEVREGCSGGGGLVPSVFPDASRRIAESRLAEFQEAGVDVLVVGCASGARRLRSVAALSKAASPEAGGATATHVSPTQPEGPKPDRAANANPQVVELARLLWEGLAP